MKPKSSLLGTLRCSTVLPPLCSRPCSSIMLRNTGLARASSAFVTKNSARSAPERNSPPQLRLRPLVPSAAVTTTVQSLNTSLLKLNSKDSVSVACAIAVAASLPECRAHKVAVPGARCLQTGAVRKQMLQRVRPLRCIIRVKVDHRIRVWQGEASERLVLALQGEPCQGSGHPKKRCYMNM